MSAPTIVLHQWFMSPFCGKVRKALIAKQLEFEIREYPGLAAAKAKRLRGGIGKLPVLDYTDAQGHSQRIHDSSAILRFLDQRHPEPPLIPKHPRDRAIAHFIEDWADESLFWFEAWFRLRDPAARTKMRDVFAQGTSPLEGFILHAVARISFHQKLRAQGLGHFDEAQITAMLYEHLDRLEDLLGDRAWLVGEHQSIADIAVAAQLHEFVRTSRVADELRRRERLWAWLERNPG